MNRAVSISALAFATALMAAQSVWAGPVTSTSILIASEDGYARQQAPNNTHGLAGALHVSGSMATNENGQMLGNADSWIRYDTTAAIAQFNSELGSGNWMIQLVQLSLREQAFPNSTNLTRGAGDFEVTWIANDNWTEGDGTSNDPGTGAGNELDWNHSQTLLNGALDQSLGIFRSLYETGRRNFTLDLNADFISDVESGGDDVSLRLSAAETTIGYTFNSEDNPFNAASDDPFQTRKPLMIIQAVQIPEPATMSLLLVAGTLVVRRRRS